MRPARRRRPFSTFDSRERIAARRLEPFLALLLGLAFGLWIAWGPVPRARVDTSPAALRADYKDEYRLLIASAYAATGDLNRARVRLALLDDPDPAAALLEQSRWALAAGASPKTVFLLSTLAEAVRQSASAPTQAGTAESSLPPPGPTAAPSSFRLVVQQVVCRANLPAGLAQIEVRDAAKQPMPGVAVVVASEAGQQRLYTGLKPELGAGYADFVMSAGVVYSVQIPPSSEAVEGLSLPLCTDEQTGGAYWGGYLLIFEKK